MNGLTMHANAWRRPPAEMPERDVPIEWMDSSGGKVRGRFIGVWMMDSGMYVYYMPTHWRYQVASEIAAGTDG